MRIPPAVRRVTVAVRRYPASIRLSVRRNGSRTRRPAAAPAGRFGWPSSTGWGNVWAGIAEGEPMRGGDIDVHPIADGTFRASPDYFGEHVSAHGHEDLFDRHGQAWFPIGCFLVRTGSPVVLIDAGLGPDLHDDGPRRLLVGGQLMTGLRAAGVSPEDIDVVIFTHLH